jgi:molybdate-binding protein
MLFSFLSYNKTTGTCIYQENQIVEKKLLILKQLNNNNINGYSHLSLTHT